MNHCLVLYGFCRYSRPIVNPRLNTAGKLMGGVSSRRGNIACPLSNQEIAHTHECNRSFTAQRVYSFAEINIASERVCYDKMMHLLRSQFALFFPHSHPMFRLHVCDEIVRNSTGKRWCVFMSFHHKSSISGLRGVVPFCARWVKFCSSLHATTGQVETMSPAACLVAFKLAPTRHNIRAKRKKEKKNANKTTNDIFKFMLTHLHNFLLRCVARSDVLAGRWKRGTRKSRRTGPTAVVIGFIYWHDKCNWANVWHWKYEGTQNTSTQMRHRRHPSRESTGSMCAERPTPRFFVSSLAKRKREVAGQLMK